MNAIRDKHSEFIMEMEIETQSKLQTNKTYKYKCSVHFPRVFFLAFK